MASWYAAKECLAAENPDVFFELLAEDIADADAFWESVVAESTKPRSEYISVRTWVRSVAKGAEEPIVEWVLPGHGPCHGLSTAKTRARRWALARRAVHFEEPARDDYGAVRYLPRSRCGGTGRHGRVRGSSVGSA